MACRWVILACLLARGFGVLGQGILEGRVTDSLGNPLVAASVEVWAEPDSARVAFGYTAADGRFSLGVDQNGDYLLRIRALSFHPHEQVVVLTSESVARKYYLHAILRERPILLPEVVVNAEKPIRVGRDTVELRVAAFLGGGERVAEDVLRRLPGLRSVPTAAYGSGARP